MKAKSLKGSWAVLMFLLAGAIVSSCAKKVSPEPEPTGEVTNAEINTWILDSMQVYYYWKDNIPAKSSLNMSAAPTAFFESLLKKPDDRFSWIQNAEDLANSMSGVIKTSGLGLAFFRIGESNAGITVRYVHKGSPADLAGIKRGDLFIRVNGQAMGLVGNSVTNVDAVFGNETFTLTKGILNENVISAGTDVTLTPVEGFQESAIHMDIVLTTPNGTKVGYLFYNRFLWEQAQELVDAFNRFKTAGVTELIVDERYNSGGSVSVAALLSALIHKDFSINSSYIKYKFNSNFREATYTYGQLFGAGNASVVSTNNLGLSRVFFLATGNSASASELVINNLRPFMGEANVIHIGETTRGKDDASISIYHSSPRFKEKKENDWGLQPIILKYTDKNGVGGFINGLTPTYEVEENFPYAPMGSDEDPMIGKALSIIDPTLQALYNLRMGVIRDTGSPFSLEVLSEFNNGLSNPRPLDVTESLKGTPLVLR